MSATVTRASRDREVTPGVYRFGSDRINWYAIEEDERYTVVDAGLPGHYQQLRAFLAERGAGLDVVEAVVLTHGHPDHIGNAERLRREEATVYAHAADDALLATGGGRLPRFFLRNIYRPHVVSFLLEGVRGGVTDVESVTVYERVEDGETLDVPGSPEVFHVPGHTLGSCALAVPDRRTLLVSDAMVTKDLLTGRDTPPTLPPFFEDSDLALQSLGRLDELGDVTILVGHGEPWTGDAAEAVRLARSSV